jgi:hypothetical protein
VGVLLFCAWHPFSLLKGKWDSRMVKLWEIEEIGGDVFAGMGRILSDEEDTLYVVDRKRYNVFIIDKEVFFAWYFLPGDFFNNAARFLII